MTEYMDPKPEPIPELHMAPDRDRLHEATGFYVRAKNPATGKWENADMAQLDEPSLKAWLSGFDKSAVIGVIAHLMGHSR